MRLMAVLGSGGHTAELSTLIAELDSSKFPVRTYVVAETDSLGTQKAQQIEDRIAKGNLQSSSVCKIPRSREVGQSFFTSFFTTLLAVYVAFKIVLLHKPDVVLVNGPGTCIPICFAAFISRSFCSWDGRIAYVESIARVTSLSLSGKLLYHLRIADLFCVQWQELRTQFPRAVYAGRLY